MRFGDSGMWGNGIYFAVNALYSNSYAYPLPNGRKQFFFANVLAGDSHYCTSDRNIKIPPEKGTSGSTSVISHKPRYDSCSGDTGGSRIFILYTHGRAYPTYLITYS